MTDSPAADTPDNKDDTKQLREGLVQQGYCETGVTISILKANVMAILLALPFIAVGIVLFFLLWQGASFRISLPGLVILLVAFLLSIIVHELLHGLGWGLFCKQGFKSIRFGVMWKMLTPYCHCKEALSFWPYFCGGMLPFFILGLIPLIIALVIGSPLLLAFSFLSILGAGGDLTIMGMLMKHRNALIVDHPSDCGFYAYTKAE